MIFFGIRRVKVHVYIAQHTTARLGMEHRWSSEVVAGVVWVLNCPFG